MNDLELIGEFQSDASGPDAETTSRARAALLEAIWREPPVPAVRSRRAHRRRWWAGVAVAAAVAAALALPTWLPRGDAGAPASAAAAVLHRAARTAAGQPAAAPPRPGQYVYTRSRGDTESDWYDVGPNHDQWFAVRMPIVRQAWIGPDGSGRLVERTGAARFPSARDRRVWIAAGRPLLGGGRTSSESFGPGGLSYLDLTKLPTDPSRLRALIEARKVEGGPPGDIETFTIVGDLLRETYAPPKLRAALYEIASGLPEVKLFGVTRWTGRRGVAIGYVAAGSRHELVFDPRTSAMLGERTVSVRTGAVTGWTVYEASGVVDSTSATP